MSVHRRNSASETDALYHPIPQDVSHATVDLQLEDDEEALAEGFVAHEHAVTHDHRIGWIHFILGCAVLLPWNALITASPYFLSRVAGSPLRDTFSSYLSTTFTVANFFFLAHATATEKQSTNSRRALLSIAALTILTLMLTLSTYFHPSAEVFFVFTILNGVAQAAAGSYLQTSVIAVASLFGPTALQSMMSGQAAIAVAVSGVEVVSAAISLRNPPAPGAAVDAEPEEKSAFLFFALSTLFYLVSAAAHMQLTRIPAYHELVGRFNHASHQVGGSDSAREEKRSQLLRIAKTNVVFNFSVAYVFITTLSVFPPITLSILPTDPRTHPLLFTAIHFFVFNLGDFLGRYICQFQRVLIWASRRLLVMSLARTLFIPVFLMCNIQRSSASGPSTAIISSDVLFMLILAAFGMSNGYVSSLCMMAAPSVEHNPRLKGRVEDVDVAATVASFHLVGGLAVGSFASFAVRAAVCGCNPFIG
ncbi:equilibrative nucleoside transporter 1 [Phanerochaete sordida]|uniref:Equilibrative nucleoside transporter 1 n=1 Tax=Phanerochaete sordida TaxID=48140 RepID=A0A9P3FXG4_9APHY|nr:equilibrative nucleoside transporter 1 [Phanerochaete sordida]